MQFRPNRNAHRHTKIHLYPNFWKHPYGPLLIVFFWGGAHSQKLLAVLG